MKISVEGIITSIEVKTKNDEPITELLLAQQGEIEQVKVRLKGDLSEHYQPFEIQNFSGRLMVWESRGNIGKLVLADGN